MFRRIILAIILGCTHARKEVTIPVQLWDSYNNPAVAPDEPNNNGNNGVFPPRYLVGMMGTASQYNFIRNGPNKKSQRKNTSPSMKHYFAFDLGNPGETILTSPDCLSCSSEIPSDNCPSVVPSCDDETNNESSTLSSFCWPSHPDQFLSPDSFSFLDSASSSPSCPQGIKSAGSLLNVTNTTCIQCFDGGDHSRYFTPATSSQLGLIDHNGYVVYTLPAPFQFGAMIRSVPIIDRLWSNVGLGYHSGFLNQTGFKAFYFQFQPRIGGDENWSNNIIFDPHPSRYENAPSVPFWVDRHRHYSTAYFSIDGEKTSTESSGDVTFIMDTGNDGVSLNDTRLISSLEKLTGGLWLSDRESDPSNYGNERLYVPFAPNEAPEWKVALRQANDSVVEVTFPGWKWVTKSFREKESYRENVLFPTIFVTYPYDLNVLGLPFLSANNVDLVFDDELQRLFFVDVDHGDTLSIK